MGARIISRRRFNPERQIYASASGLSKHNAQSFVEAARMKGWKSLKIERLEGGGTKVTGVPPQNKQPNPIESFNDLARIEGEKTAQSMHVKYKTFAELEAIRAQTNSLNPYRTRKMREAWNAGFLAEVDTAIDARID